MPKVPAIIPITDFRQDAAAALERVRRSSDPVVITQRGRAAAVMLSIEAYERAEREREELLRTVDQLSAGREPGDQPVPREPATFEHVAGVLRSNRAVLERYGVRSLSVFGSVARGTAGPESDVDLLVEFDRPVTLFDLGGLQQELSVILGRHADLVTADGLRPGMRERVLNEAVRAA